MMPPRPRVATLLLALGAALVPTYVVLGTSTAADVVYLVGLAVATAAAAVATVSTTRSPQTMARLLTLALAAYTIGDTLWYVIVWTGGDPDGSLADPFYLCAYLALAAVLLLLLAPLHRRRWVVDGDVVIDVLTVVTVCVVLLWELVIRSDAPTFGLSTLTAQTAVVYPLIDAVVIGLALHAVTQSRGRGRVVLPLGAALACWLVGDYDYLFTYAEDVFSAASSVLWMAGALLIAWAATRLAGLGEPTEPRERSTGLRLSLAIGPLLVPPALVPIEQAMGRNPESWSLVVAIVVLIALAFVRTERLLATERRMRLELAATRDVALEASRAKSAFLASMSHEIRTPMNGVVGLARLLDETELDDQQRHYTQGIHRAGESLMALLNDVLDFAKFESGTVTTEAFDFDLLEVVEDVASMVAEQAHHHGVELVATCAPDLPRGLRGDATKLRQVLLNLAANAVKFTAHGEVVIAASRDLTRDPTRVPASGPTTSPEVWVRFAVRDTGIGIDEADRGRVFEAFSQVDVSTTRRYGGTGLGLAIAHELLTAMGGEISLESSSTGGSTFAVRLPLGLACHQQPVATRPSRAGSGTRVLVVDDNASSSEALHEQLTAWGMRVDTAAGATTALGMLAAARTAGASYDLLVADAEMPRTTGLELATQVRADADLAATPVLLLTTGAGVGPAQLAAAGVDVSLPKPVQVARLQVAVQRALGGPADRHAQPLLLTRPTVATRGVVLVVEDSEVNRLVAVGTLRQLGYLTDVATNGHEAVEMVRLHRYDAVLMDCRMPELDGYEATAAIRRDEAEGGSDHRVPIIAVTASTEPGQRARCLAAGMDDHVVKPLGRRALDDVLARWVPAVTAV